MLCFVVIAEEVAAGARGWASGTLSAMDYLGAGVASLVFAAVTILPYGWRAIYVIGAVPLFLVAYLRRRLPETKRFEAQENVTDSPVQTVGDPGAAARSGAAISRAATDHPDRGGGLRLCDLTRLDPVVQISAERLSLHAWPGDAAVHSRRPDRPGAGDPAAGRLSDRIGRKPMACAIVALAGVGFALFYSGAPAPGCRLCGCWPFSDSSPVTC